MTIVLVIDAQDNPGRVLACFSNSLDADMFLNSIETMAYTEERTLFYGQPDFKGYNK